MTAVPQCVTDKVYKKYMYPCNVQINRCQYVDMTRQRVTVYQKFRCIFFLLTYFNKTEQVVRLNNFELFTCFHCAYR